MRLERNTGKWNEGKLNWALNLGSLGLVYFDENGVGGTILGWWWLGGYIMRHPDEWGKARRA